MELSGQSLMDSLYARIAASPALARSLPGSYKFLLHGLGGGVWVLRGGESPELLAGIRTADCSIECSLETLAGIIESDINPQVAYLENDLRVTGDYDALLRLVRIWEK